MQGNNRHTERSARKGAPHRASTRIDLTPMVDLGFLLITFFMLTTILNRPQVMPVVMPDKDPIDDPPELSDHQVLTLLLGGRDKVYWYEELSNARLDSTGYEPAGLRKVILDKKARVRQQSGDRLVSDLSGGKKAVSKLSVIIKATPAARYKNVVDVFDEMKICGIAHYIMLDISPEEAAFLDNPAAGLQFSETQQVAAAYHH